MTFLPSLYFILIKKIIIINVLLEGYMVYYLQTSSHLSVTVYVEDINDHAPQFIGTPYHVFVDEFTPPGEY